ncbi:MAG TPA: ATP-binding cassette domain-containing protein [Thermoanaerobaculia bacterium]|nr:ATP-binding cassette domain-containing protein [Thermoanaerobaculia bacterium]
MSTLLEARGLSKRFRPRGGLPTPARRSVWAVAGVDLDLDAGECLALVGESGSGKSTLGRMVMRLLPPTSGSIRFAGEDLLALSGAALRRRRRELQMVFQDPLGSLHPRLRVGRALAEPLAVHQLRARRQRQERVDELLSLVGLAPEVGRRFPHQLSGGQRQRVGIARALATEPRLLVADEPVSALDVSVRAQVLNLLVELQRRFALALLFIAHDLSVVEGLADRVAVMQGGRIVEEGPTAEVFGDPRHPYTVRLLEAVPGVEPTPRRELLEG